MSVCGDSGEQETVANETGGLPVRSQARAKRRTSEQEPRARRPTSTHRKPTLRIDLEKFNHVGAYHYMEDDV